MKEIKSIENFLPEAYQLLLEGLILRSGVGYRYCCSTVDGSPPESLVVDALTKECPQFVHSISYERNQRSEFLYNITPITYHFCAHTGINIEDVTRCKINITVPSYGFSNDIHNTPHYDTLDPDMITAIYYVNDSDGDTFFFENPKKDHKASDKLVTIDRHRPKRGKLVWFDSDILHSGQPPFFTPGRAVINFVARKKM